MGIKIVEGIGIAVLVLGVFMVVVGGILWFYEETTETAGPKFPTTIVTRPYADIGHWLYNTGYPVIILGIAVGFIMRRAEVGKRKGV